MNEIHRIGVWSECFQFQCGALTSSNRPHRILLALLAVDDEM